MRSRQLHGRVRRGQTRDPSSVDLLFAVSRPWKALPARDALHLAGIVFLFRIYHLPGDLVGPAELFAATAARQPGAQIADARAGLDAILGFEKYSFDRACVSSSGQSVPLARRQKRRRNREDNEGATAFEHERVADGIPGVPTLAENKSAMLGRGRGPYTSASSCAQEMFITVLIDYDAKPAGSWHQGDAVVVAKCRIPSCRGDNLTQASRFGIRLCKDVEVLLEESI